MCEDYNMQCDNNYDPGCIKTYPASYPIPDGTIIDIGGSCSNHGVISKEMEQIERQSITNRETLETHTKNRDELLKLAVMLIWHMLHYQMLIKII